MKQNKKSHVQSQSVLPEKNACDELLKNERIEKKKTNKKENRLALIVTIWLHFKNKHQGETPLENDKPSAWQETRADVDFCFLSFANIHQKKVKQVKTQLQ